MVEARRNDREVDIDNVTTQLSVVAEAYPELKSDANYRELMNELSITENMIAEYRKSYNSQIKTYNKYVRKFPQNKILRMMGYEVIQYRYLQYEESEKQSVNNLFEE